MHSHGLNGRNSTSHAASTKAASSLVTVFRFQYIHVGAGGNYRRCLLSNRRQLDGFAPYLATRYATL